MKEKFERENIVKLIANLHKMGYKLATLSNVNYNIMPNNNKIISKKNKLRLFIYLYILDIIFNIFYNIKYLKSKDQFRKFFEYYYILLTFIKLLFIKFIVILIQDIDNYD